MQRLYVVSDSRNGKVSYSILPCKIYVVSDSRNGKVSYSILPCKIYTLLFCDLQYHMIVYYFTCESEKGK